ncbi:MAG: DUF2892 domain-containing protein [Nocardioides sp.]
MNQNVGSADRKLRAVLVAPALVVIGLLVGPGGWLALVLYGLAVVMWATAAAGSCPVYSVLGLRTCPLQRVSNDDSEPASTR